MQCPDGFELRERIERVGRSWTRPVARALGLAVVVMLVLLACVPRHPPVSDEVTIYRDSMGIPHVYGDTAGGVMFGAGYAMAEDRLFQIEFLSRYGRGELAELLGPDYVPVDQLARTEGYTDAERQAMVEVLDPEHRELFRMLTRGINRYVDEALADPEEKLPIEFSALGIPLQPYTDSDLVAVLKVVMRYYGSYGGRELENLAFYQFLVERHGEKDARVIFDDILVLNDPDAKTIIPAEERTSFADGETPHRLPGRQTPSASLVAAELAAKRRLAQRVLGAAGITPGASRSMVIGPTRSSNGNVLMMQATADGIDMHLSGGGFEAAGLVIPPMGVPVMGRTADFGWLGTTSENDTQDIYSERLNPENSRQYWYEGEWRDMAVRQEVIQVAGGEPVSFTVARTVHGPVLAWDIDNHTAYSKRFALWKQEAEAWAATVRKARSRTLEEFEEALKTSPHSFNATYGDRNGHIEYWQAGRRPIRPQDVDPRLPIPGTGEYEWQGFAPFSEWPTVANPDQAYLFAWNSKASADTQYGDASRWGKHYRVYLPIELIESDDAISVEDLKRFNRIIAAGWGSVDLTVTSPDFFEPYLLAAASDGDDPRLLEAARHIADWNGLYEDQDGDQRYDHVGLTLFSE
jgi:penicillin amidase